MFLVEGYKSVAEFLNSPYQITTVYHTPAVEPNLLKLSDKINYVPTTLTNIQKISSLTTATDVIAVVKTPTWPVLSAADLKNKFALVLDGVQDPGNLGTIIRTADWFGIQHIICSEDSVDAYNPKVVQATMGSLARVNVYYQNLPATLPAFNMPVYGALLDGETIYNVDFGNEGVIVLGNEGKGMRPEVKPLISRAVTIPRAGAAESLNVAIAAALFCSEINRNKLK